MPETLVEYATPYVVNNSRRRSFFIAAGSLAEEATFTAGANAAAAFTATVGVPPLQAPAADEYTTLWEFALATGGTELLRIYKSFEGVRTPSADYEQGLLSMGRVTHAIGPGAEPYSVGQLTVEAHNTDRQFSILKDGYRFRGRKQYVRFGRIADGLAAMRQIFVGAVDKWEISADGKAEFLLKDSGSDRLKQLLRDHVGTISTAIFPDLPGGRPEVLINTIYGDHSTNGGNMVGAGPVPCYLIDADAAGKWRYLVAGHACESVDAVYIYGVLQGSGFTVTTDVYDNRTMTVIDFDSDPRDTSRPNETEVTVLVKGIMAGSPVDLITNLVEQAEHFLLNYAGWSSSELDATLWADAKAAAQNNLLNGDPAPYKGAVFIGGDVDLRVLDVLNEFTRHLLYFWMTPEDKLGTFLLSLSRAQNPPAAAFSVNESEMAKRTFSVWGNRDVYSSISYQRVYNWTLGKFAVTAEGSQSIPVLRSFPMPHSSRVFPVAHPDRTFPVSYDAGAMGDLNLGDEDTPDAPSKLVSLKYVADQDTAISIASVYAMLASERVEFCSFELPPEFILNSAADLNRYVGVTHYQGISSTGGYQNTSFRIFRTEAALQLKGKRLKCTGIRLVA